MTWILFFAIMSGNGHSTSSQEFGSEESCVAARDVYMKTFTNSWSGHPVAVCVAKGDK